MDEIKNRGPIGPEDYAEPRCLLCDEPYGKEPPVKSIPQARIIEKMDEYMAARDYAGAERHLNYWLEEARLGHDSRGELLIRNESIGFYRKRGNKEKTHENIKEALSLITSLGMEKSRTGGTTYVNVATGYNSFGENEEAIKYFALAREAYLSLDTVPPELLGGLYNNTGLCLCALGRYEEAHRAYDSAYEIMKKTKGAELEVAITCLNRADTYEAQLGSEECEGKVAELLDEAYDLFDAPGLEKDGYYAFVCVSCAPTFEHYGYFLAANELKKRANEYYENERS